MEVIVSILSKSSGLLKTHNNNKTNLGMSLIKVISALTLHHVNSVVQLHLTQKKSLFLVAMMVTGEIKYFCSTLKQTVVKRLQKVDQLPFTVKTTNALSSTKTKWLHWSKQVTNNLILSSSQKAQARFLFSKSCLNE